MNVIVLVGTDADALGEAARELASENTRAAVFVGDVTTPDGRAALREFVAGTVRLLLTAPALTNRRRSGAIIRPL